MQIFRESVQYGTSTPKTVFILVLSSTEYDGLFTGLGYSSLLTHLKRPSFHSAPDAGCKSPVGGSETTEWNVPGKKKPEDASPVVPDCEDYN